jgi:aldose sugar dehydrogenase
MPAMGSIGLNRRRLVWMFGAAVLASCGGSDESKPPLPVGDGQATVQTFASGLINPWGMAFLPDGRLLVTEKGGSLQLVSADGSSKSPVAVSLPGGLVTGGQGGLLDVAIDPDFTSGQPLWVYLSYARPGAGGSGTAVMRGQLDLTNPAALTNPTLIFEQSPRATDSRHYGSRLVFAGDKTLFITLGERHQGSPAQDLNSHLGKVVRINRDGSFPPDNPTFGGAPHSAGIWSYGHRNPQGAALHPSGQLWVSEHGPQGGDEINIAFAGSNFGWPNVSYGCPDGASSTPCAIGGGTHDPLYTEPLTHWEPSIAPAGMLFYSGTMFSEWQGNLFVGALADMGLWRLTVTNTAVTAREQFLPAEINMRVRDVAEGPDGAIYVIGGDPESNGRIVRITR